MKKLVVHYNDGYIFKEKKPYGMKLTISCHGDFATKEAKLNGVSHNAMSLFKIIEGLRVCNIAHLRLAICHSADGYLASLASELSRLMPLTRVTGYAGTVTTGFPEEDANAAFEDFGAGDGFHFELNEYFKIYKKDSASNKTTDVYYHSITFYQGKMLHQESRIINICNKTFLQL